MAQEDISVFPDPGSPRMYGGHFGYFTLKGAASYYGVGYSVVRDLARKLDLGQERVGRTRVFAPAELPILEIGLRALGYTINVNTPSLMDPTVTS
jgi:hypothetical protein